MKRTIKLGAEFTGVISTGSYENERPLFSIEETIEYDEIQDESQPVNHLDDFLRVRQGELQAICREQFKQQAEVSYQEKIAKSYQNLRFYPGDKGLKYPSVTSIIGWDKDFFMSPEHLQQYASRGTIIDKQVELFLKATEAELLKPKEKRKKSEELWKLPKDIPEIYPDLVIVTRGDLGLELDNVDFQAFYKAFPFKVVDQQSICINDEHRYGGRREILCIIESTNKAGWEKIKDVKFDVLTLLDVKATTALDKTYVMKQNTAYVKGSKEKIEQIGVIHLKKDNVQGYAKPVIETNMEKYWTLFLRDRENFTKRYGL